MGDLLYGTGSKKVFKEIQNLFGSNSVRLMLSGGRICLAEYLFPFCKQQYLHSSGIVGYAFNKSCSSLVYIKNRTNCT